MYILKTNTATRIAVGESPRSEPATAYIVTAAPGAPRNIQILISIP